MTLSPLDEAGVKQAVEQAKLAFAQAGDSAELKAARIEHMGDNSALATANRAIKDLDPSEKAAAGKAVGKARKIVAAALAEREEVLKKEELARVLQTEAIDITVGTQRSPQGARHPVELLQEQIADMFLQLGWDIAEGPEIEHEWFNFDALNIDPDHPAREEQDTLYIDSASIGEQSGDDIEPAHLLLRTHTSPVQARVLLTQELPVYVACPGKVFRADELDATHSPVFHQVEGLAIDSDLTMADLKGTLEYFAKYMFGPEAKIRLRPSFFPFTEPSAELDLWFPQKKGGPGWIEWGGCGMVNPHVLRACGIDTKRYSGFAFGMGIERTLMLRHGVNDIHDIVEGDIRFSQQFGTTGKGK
ncbi:MAG: phenylalanine--tRNA ligase subunit alpha [Actinomycetaceae bacterium]|nr:phenylalanine--tRNA ligase subunit alpha [Actinomycetaceae bacterium]